MRKLSFLFIISLFLSSVIAQSNWEPVSGLNGSNIYRTIFNSEDVIFTYVLNGGMWTSDDLGANWSQINFGLNETNVLSFALGNNDVVFAGTDYDGVYSFDTASKTWTQILPASLKFNAIDANSTGLVIAGANFGFFFRSTDNGITWDSVLVENEITVVNDILVTEENHIYVGCDNREVYVSYDSGDSWTKNTIGIAPASYINSLIVNSNGTIFAGIDHGGVLKSADDGKSWQFSNTGLPTNTHVRFLNLNSQGIMFAVLKNNSVYQSLDEGSTWTIFDEGTNGITINTITSSSNGFTLIGTNSGLFKTHYSATDVKDSEEPLQKEYSLSQNYPNPFNPSTTINFSLKESSSIKLIVYNSIGEQVATVVNQQFSAGSHHVKFNAGALPSGSYFYKIDVNGKFSETKKMLLIK